MGMTQLRSAAKKLGASVSVDVTAEWTEVRVVAPDGRTWACSEDVSELVEMGRTGPGARDVIADRLMADVRDGLNY